MAAASTSSALLACGLEGYKVSRVSSACSCLFVTSTLYTKYVQKTTTTSTTSTRTHTVYASTVTTKPPTLPCLHNTKHVLQKIYTTTPTVTSTIYPLFNLLTSDGRYVNAQPATGYQGEPTELRGSPNQYSFYLNSTTIYATDGDDFDIYDGVTAGYSVFANPGIGPWQALDCSLAANFSLTCTANGFGAFGDDGGNYLVFGDASELEHDFPYDQFSIVELQAVGFAC